MVDRFHLVHTLRQALEAFLLNHRAALQAAAVGTAMALTPLTGSLPVTPMYQGRRQSPKPAQREEASRQHRHAPWVAIYEAVHALQVQGIPLATIARQLGISRPTVYAYLRRETPPGPQRPQWRPSAQVLTPYIPYLIRRLRERGANSMQLWREIQALGYTHSDRTVCRFISRLRRVSEAELSLERHRPRPTPARRGRPPVRCRSPWCARPRSDRRTRRPMSRSSVRRSQASRGRMR